MDAAPGEERPRVRCRGVGPADIFTIEGKRDVAGGKELRPACRSRVAVAQAQRSVIRIDQRRKNRTREISERNSRSHRKVAPEDSSTALRSAATGFYHH